MHTNIYWVGTLGKIGGVETAIFELAKLFQDYDFVVYYKYIPEEQLNRLKKYVRCIKYNDEKLKCKKFFMNYDISIIDNVEAEEYIEIIHCVFSHNENKPHTHPKITKYYAVGQEACESFKLITGEKCEVLHNPLQIDKPRKILRLISATRLASDKGKIVERMQKLCNMLDTAEIPYEWKVFTNGGKPINDKVIFMKPTLDIRDWIADSDYVVQLSDTEAFCYTVLESLYLNVPVIVTDIPCFKEMGVKNGVNGYILDFNMTKVPIYDIYNNIPKFNYEPLKDEWEDMIVKVKSNYKEERKMKVRVIATKKFEGIRDAERNVYPKEGDTWEVSKERADYLEAKGVIEILPTIKQETELKEIKIERETLPDIEDKLEEHSQVEKWIEEPKKKTTKKSNKKK